MITYRRRRSGTSLIRAFWEVIKSGGDNDQAQPRRRKMPKGIRNRRTKFAKERRDSLRNEPIVLDVSENFVKDAERIRTTYNPNSSTQTQRSRDATNYQVEEEKQSIGAEDSISGCDHGSIKDNFDNDSDLSISPSVLDYGQGYNVSEDDDLEYDDSETEEVLEQQEVEGEQIMNEEEDGMNTVVKDTHGVVAVPPGFYDLGR